MDNFIKHWQLHWLKYIAGISLIFLFEAYFYLYRLDATGVVPIQTGQIGGEPTADSYTYGVRSPTSIVFDSNGNMFVSGNDTSIYKYNNTGKLLLSFGGVGTANDKFLYIERMAIDNQGNIYVADADNNRIQKFDNNGNFIYKFGTAGSGDGQFLYPDSVAIDPATGNIYVSDYDRNDIQVFSPTGTYITKFGSAGSGDGQFNAPYGITFDKNNDIYVADSRNHRVQKFASSTYAFLSKFGSQGSGDGQFYYPTNAVVDSNNDLWVSDSSNNRVQKFSSTTNAFLFKFGIQGSGDGQINNGYGDIALDAQGNIYVAEYNNSRIQKFDSNGNFIRKWQNWSDLDGKFNYPVESKKDLSGNLYVVDSYNNRIQKFDSNGNFLMKFGTRGSGDGQLDIPNSIAIATSGDMYIVDTNNHRIQKFDQNGNFISKFGTYGSGDGQLDIPNSIAIATSGDMYIADTNNHRIQKFDQNGNFLMKFGTRGSGDGQFNYPQGITISRSGDMYIADTNNHRIQKFDQNGNFISKFGTYGSGDGQLDIPNSIAIATSGDMYIADTNNHRIQKFDQNGNFLMKFGTRGSGDGQFNYPQGITISRSGDMYIADTNGIQKFDSNGNFIYKFGTHGYSQNQLGGWNSVFIDSYDTIYVSDSLNSRISIYSAPAFLFSNISATSSSGSSTFSWTSSRAASSKVQYGLTTAYGTTTPETDTSPKVTQHSVTVASSFPDCTTINYKLISSDEDNTIFSSANQTLTTAGCVNMSQVISTNQVQASSSATSTLQNTGLSLSIPPSVATSSSLVFQVNKLEPSTFFQEAKTPEGKVVVTNSVFHLAAIDTTNNSIVPTFSKPIAVSVTYSPSDLNGIDPTTLSIYRYDNNSWYPLSNCSTNTDTYTVTCHTSNFSDFALFAVPKPAGGAAYYVTPGDLDSGTAKAEAVKIQAEAVKLSANNDTPIKQAIESLNKTTILLTNNLSLGLFSKEVSLLQAYLATMPNIYPEALVTGYYGKLTQKAVQRYQCARNIICQGTPNSTGWGVVGPRTRGEVGR